MHALLQLRSDEVGIPVPGLGQDELLTLWVDLDGDLFSAIEGKDFKVSTYPSAKELMPLGPGYRETAHILTFPISWHDPVPHQPSWEDFAFRNPDRVAWSDTSDWFYENPICTQGYDLQKLCPIKIGGWPTWIQGSQWDDTASDEDFVLQVDSTDKGRIGFGDSGSIYLFRNRSNGSWSLRCDFF